jgi:adenosylhomocysteine nucleosidase
MPEVAIVAALEREIRPLVRHWRVSDREYSGRRFRFFECEHRVAMCGGIGAQAARRAAEAIISLYRPAVVQSVGFAGGLDSNLRIGELFEPRQVIDASDGSRTDTGAGSGILVSFSSIASREQKSRLATAYQAQAVDMEAAAVAKAAEAHGLRFVAVKVISDDASFAVPSMDGFIASDGGFRSGAFALHAAVRPWLWSSVFRLARNSTEASRRLCEYLSSNAGEMRTVVSTKFAP